MDRAKNKKHFLEAWSSEINEFDKLRNQTDNSGIKDKIQLAQSKLFIALVLIADEIYGKDEVVK